MSALRFLPFLLLAVLLAACGSAPPETPEAPSPAADTSATVRFWAAFRSATAHRIAGRWEEAARDYRTAHTLRPDHEDALYYLANVEMERGRYEAAREALDRLLALNPRSVRGFIRRGDLFVCGPETPSPAPEDALADYERAHHLNAEQTGPLLRMAAAHLILGQFDAARPLLDDVLALLHDNPEAHLLRGYVAWKTGRRDLALRHLEAARQGAAPRTQETGRSNEGDTRSGATPLARSEACHPFAPFVRRLTEGPSTPSIYEDLDAYLARFARRS